MIKLDAKNTGIKPRRLDREIHSLKKKKEALFLKPHEQNVSEIVKFAAAARKKFQNVVVIGIGGSILGAKTLFETLRHPYWNLVKKPRVFFIDNLDTGQVMGLGDVVSKSETLFVIVSKSGETIETMNIFRAISKKAAKENLVIITEKNKGALYKTAQKKRLKTFLIPKEIPGRFSVFTAAGLLPAALCGIDIKKLLAPAKKIKLNGIPSRLAYIQYKLNKKATVIFPYSSGFAAFCEWYKQLLAESLGKKGKGVTPVTAIGPKDQHSLLQLLLDGPKDKFILFIETPDKHFGKIISAEKKATEKILTKRGQKNATITLPLLDEEHVGQLLFALEAQIALCGELYRINAFNQPGVEKVKKLTKEILGQN